MLHSGVSRFIQNPHRGTKINLFVAILAFRRPDRSNANLIQVKESLQQGH